MKIETRKDGLIGISVGGWWFDPMTYDEAENFCHAILAHITEERAKSAAVRAKAEYEAQQEKKD